MEYTKQKAEAVKQHRGYQTIEAKEHPDVKKAEKAHNLTSDVSKTEQFIFSESFNL